MAGNFGQIREAVKHYRKTTEINRCDDYYPVDRYHAAGYFETNKKWKEIIRAYFGGLHNKGKEVVHVDICGRATAESLGADRSYCFSLKTPKHRRRVSRALSDADNVFIEGDLFSTPDFLNFMNRLKEDNVHPALVTFEPIVGLQGYNPLGVAIPEYPETTYGLLEKRLKTMIEILQSGGYVYLGKPFQTDGLADFVQGKREKDYEISLHLKKIARQQKCRIAINEEFNGPYFLINKRA